MREIVIDGQTSGQRLDRFARKFLNRAPKDFVYKMIRKRNIKLNGTKAGGSEVLRDGDIVSLYLSDETIDGFTAEKPINIAAGALDIIFEDDGLLVVNKPPGVLSQPDSADVRDSVADRAAAYLRERVTPGFTPAVANRLDRNTSGVVAVGKTAPALAWLGSAFADNACEKVYLALVVGDVREPFEVRAYISKNAHNTAIVTANATEAAKYAVTRFEPLANARGYTLLRVIMETGRFHQIRASLRFAGFPIVGDHKYGDMRVNNEFRRKFSLASQLLHCESLMFTQADGVLGHIAGRRFKAELPAVFEKIIACTLGRV